MYVFWRRCADVETRLRGATCVRPDCPYTSEAERRLPVFEAGDRIDYILYRADPRIVPFVKRSYN